MAQTAIFLIGDGMKVVVCGGGASGMTAAIWAAGAGHQVTLLEHKDRIGKKLLATGNGRCNLTNEALLNNPWEQYLLKDDKSFEKTEVWLRRVFEQFGYADTISFFEKLGLVTRSRQGLIYPYSDQATAVLDVLRFEIEDLGIKVVTSQHVNKITGDKNTGFVVSARHTEDNTVFEYKADRVILANGSKAQPKLGADGSGYKLARELGHKVATPRPGLVQLKSDEDYFKSIAGTRIGAECTLYVGKRKIVSESGELQLTAYGISGIVIMNLSNYLPIKSADCKFEDVNVVVDVMPNIKKKDVLDILKRRVEEHPKRQSSEFLVGILPKKIGDLFLKLCNIGYTCRYKDIALSQLEKLTDMIKGWRILVTDTNSFEDSQIALGGVVLEEVKDTMESKVKPGVYLCGEMLDIHGRCGGYNLQLAWSTGAIAGMLR